MLAHRRHFADHLPWLGPTVLMVALMGLAAWQQACTPRENTGTPAASPELSSNGEDSTGGASGGPPPARILTLGGTVTEIVFALGAGDRVVAVDASSTWPEAVLALPRVGYHRSLSAEGVLALEPDLVIGTDELGPPIVVAQLESAGIRLVRVPAEATVEAALDRILRIGRAIEREDEARELAGRVERDLDRARAERSDRSRALFVYARGTSQLMVAGRDTAAETLFGLAGIPNAVDSFDGFRPLTAEAVVAAAPDVVVMTRGGVESLGGPDEVFRLPGLASTPAAETRALVQIDDLLALGFGPRLPEAVAQLRELVPPASVAR